MSGECGLLSPRNECMARRGFANHHAPLALQSKRFVYNVLFHAGARNLARDRSRSTPSRCRDRLLQRASYLGSALAASSTCPLRSRRRRPRSASGPVALLPPILLSSRLLSRVFRGKFVAALNAAFREGRRQFHTA